MDSIIELLTLIIMLLPLALRAFQLIGQATHNVKLNNLADRAGIIVDSIEQADWNLTSADKKQLALERLSVYAKEVGITATPQQLGDYIESAVRFMNSQNKK